VYVPGDTSAAVACAVGADAQAEIGLESTARRQRRLAVQPLRRGDQEIQRPRRGAARTAHDHVKLALVVVDLHRRLLVELPKSTPGPDAPPSLSPARHKRDGAEIAPPSASMQLQVGLGEKKLGQVADPSTGRLPSAASTAAPSPPEADPFGSAADAGQRGQHETMPAGERHAR